MRPPSELTLAFDYLQRELDARVLPTDAKPLRLEQASGNVYGNAQQAAVRAVFGDKPPLSGVSRVSAKRGAKYTVTIPGHAYISGETEAQWSPAIIRIDTDAAGKQAAGSVNWAGSDIHADYFQRTYRDIGVQFSQALDPSGLWLGDFRAQAKHMDFRNLVSKTLLRVDNSQLRFSTRRHGADLDQQVDLAIQHIGLGETRIDGLHVAYRLTAVKVGTLLKLTHLFRQQPAQGGSASLTDVATVLKDMALQGARLELNDLSAGFEGSRLRIKGDLGLTGATKADLSTIAGIVDKLDGRIDIALPLPMLRAATERMAKASGHAGPDDAAENMYAMILGTLLTKNYARLDKDTLVSNIVVQAGKLRINGAAQAVDVATLLQQWDAIAQPMPPEDHSTPVEVTWRDRSLAHLLLFAGNGNDRAIDELCTRYTDGTGMQGDAAEALAWCTKGAAYHENSMFRLAAIYEEGRGVGRDELAALRWYRTAADNDSLPAKWQLYLRYENGQGVARDSKQALVYLTQAAEGGHAPAVARIREIDSKWQQPAASDAQARSSEAGTLFHYDLEAGYYRETFYRFDPARTRRLTLTLSNPQRHEKWSPSIDICLTALAPSDAACVSLAAIAPSYSDIAVNTRVIAANSKSDQTTHTLEDTLPADEKVHLAVYIRGNQAHFVINNGQELVQNIPFPAELIRLQCSTASCDFKFDQQ